MSIWSRIKMESTTTLTLNSQDAVFYDVLKWMDDKTFSKLVRNYNFNNGKSYSYWNRTQPVMAVGYGRTYSIWNRKLLIMDRTKIEASQTADSKEVITVTIFGRKSDTFKKMFSEIENMNKVEITTENLTKVYVCQEGSWILSCKVHKRSLDSVVLPQKTKNEILSHLENFNKNKEWYLLNGVPYRTGIILEGPPGTGKTSMSKALAGHLNKDIYYMDATETGAQFVKNALRGVPPGSLVIIEEIDRMFDFFEKESKRDQKSPNAGPLLNALDGIVGNEDRIVIATTNHINKLDPALIREGRFDLKVHVGYMTDETLHTYIDRMYPNFGESHLYSVKENIAPCLMQKLVFANRGNPVPVLDQVAVRNTEFKTAQVNKLPANIPNP